MIFIENEGAVFQGVSRGQPAKVWNRKKKEWQPYQGEIPKPIGWGHEISKAEAERLIASA